MKLKGDSKILIDSLNGTSSVPWKIEQSVLDINVLDKLVKVSLFFLADAITKIGHGSQPQSWSCALPLYASQAFLFDSVGTGCLHGFCLQLLGEGILYGGAILSM